MPEIGFFLNHRGPGFLERGFKFINRGSFFLIFPYESEIMWSERECRANPSEFAIAYKVYSQTDRYFNMT